MSPRRSRKLTVPGAIAFRRSRAWPRRPCSTYLERPSPPLPHHSEVSIATSLPLLCLLLYLDAATLSVATTPLLLLYGRHHEPWAVAVFGGAASSLGSMTQLWLLRWALASERSWMKRLAPSRDKLEAALRQYPSTSFLALAVARATPLPDAPLKLVAAAAGYPIPLYGLATYLGSLPYYFVLALIGKNFKIPVWILLAALGIVVLGGLFDWLRRRRQRATS